MSKDTLTEYRSKRDTAASGEPAGRRGRKSGGDGHPTVWLDGEKLSGKVNEDFA